MSRRDAEVIPQRTRARHFCGYDRHLLHVSSRLETEFHFDSFFFFAKRIKSSPWGHTNSVHII
jgi:hypothetical protein